MLIKSTSKTSFSLESKQDLKKKSSNRLDPSEITRQFRQCLEEAGEVMAYSEFSLLYQKMMRILIQKAEIQSPHARSIFLSSAKVLFNRYGDNIEINVRILILEIINDLGGEENLIKLNKAKYLVLHTPFEYLLSKILLIEYKLYVFKGDDQNAYKSLKKCLELNQDHMVQYMQQEPSIRKQIVDQAIIAYYETFKLMKQKKPGNALEMLYRAYNAANKNYGSESLVTKGLYNLYTTNQSQINSLDKISNKNRAITEIIDIETKKNYHITAFYSWQDEKIIAQLIKIKHSERTIVSEATYQIKLDISKIKLLKNTEWIVITKEGQITTNQDEVLRLLGVNGQKQKQMTTRIDMRQLSREDIIKKDNISSSSDDSADFFEKKEFNFLRFGRSQSSSRKKKDLQ